MSYDGGNYGLRPECGLEHGPELSWPDGRLGWTDPGGASARPTKVMPRL